jgi:hypothetical protein
MISDSHESIEDESRQPDDAALLELEVDVRIYDLLLEAWG